MSQLIVAPTEPLQLRAIADRVHMLPESYGCDVLVFAGGLKIGVQRKELRDLLASLDDGRVAQQLAQMSTSPLDICVMLVEGEVRYTADGQLLGTWQGRGGRVWTRKQVVSVEWAVRARGVHWVNVGGLDDTVAWVQETAAYWSKPAHHGIGRRGNVVSAWGQARNHEWAAWVLQGWSGVGEELAKRIVKEYGLPLKWTVTAEELSRVKGISLAGAEKLIKTLDTGEKETGR